MHETHFCFYHYVVAGASAVRARLAVAGYAGVDKGGIECGDSFVVHFVFLEGVGEVIFDEDVAVFDELMEDGDAGGGGEGEAYGPFVSIDL